LTNNDKVELDGITLSVYLHAVKRQICTPRDEKSNLSSPSVAYRHLQKLEDLGYLQKNVTVSTVKRKAQIEGHLWLGHRLMPKMWVYSLIFLSILLVELVVLLIHFSSENLEFKVFFLLLTLITGLAMAVFTVEGLLQKKRKNQIEKE
jgi:hypothetical protein